MIFVRKVLDACTKGPVVLVDGGPWYPWALERYGLNELRQWIVQGWEYVNSLQEGETIIRLPTY